MTTSRSEYMPEKVAELVAESRVKHCSDCDHFIDAMGTALTAVSAERDRLHKAITEALELIHPSQFMTPGEPGYLGTTRDVMGARRVLRAALDKEGNGNA